MRHRGERKHSTVTGLLRFGNFGLSPPMEDAKPAHGSHIELHIDMSAVPASAAADKPASFLRPR